MAEHPQHQLHQALLEALAPLCNVQAQGRIFALAAASASSGEIPSDVFAFSEYVRGPLSTAVTEVLGEDMKDMVCQQLAPILMTASSGEQGVHGVPRIQDKNLVVVVAKATQGRDRVRDCVRGGGYRAIMCCDAMEANAVIAKRRPGVVLVESHLEGINGRQLSAMVRRAYGDQAPAFLMFPSDTPVDSLELISAIAHALNPNRHAVS